MKQLYRKRQLISSISANQRRRTTGLRRAGIQDKTLIRSTAAA